MANVIKSIKIGATSTPVIDIESIYFGSASDYVECEIEKNNSELYTTNLPNADYNQSGVITGATQTITGWKTIAGVSGFLETYSSSSFPEINNGSNYGKLQITSSVDYRGASLWTAYNSYQTANPFTWQYRTCKVTSAGVTSMVDTYSYGCKLKPSHYCCPTGKIEDGFTYSVPDIEGYHAYEIIQHITNVSAGTGNSTGHSILDLPYGPDVEYDNPNIDNLTNDYPIIWIKGRKSGLNTANLTSLNNYLNNNAYIFTQSVTPSGGTFMKIKEADLSSLSTVGSYINGVGCTSTSIVGVTYSIGTTSYTKSVGTGGKGVLQIGPSTYLDGSRRFNMDGSYSYIFKLVHNSYAYLGITGVGSSYTVFAGKAGSAFKIGCTGNHPILTSENSSYPGHIGASSYPFKSMHSQYMYSSYGFYESSDETLKNILKPIETDLDALSKLRKVYFEWKDKNNGHTGPQIGIIAQDVKKVYPEIVDGEEGSYTVQYDKLGVIALDAVDKLYKKYKELQSNYDDLKQKVEKLEKILN